MAKLKFNKKTLLVTIALFVAVGGTGIIYKQTRTNTSTENISQASGEKLNLDPPTDEEKAAAAENKNQIDQRDQVVKSNEPSQGSKRSVKPVITSVVQEGQTIQASSYVPGIFEDNGECQVLFVKNGVQITKKVTAIKEGNAVYCPLLTAQSTEFDEKGPWTVTVIYSSANAEGKSDEYKVEIK